MVWQRRAPQPSDEHDGAQQPRAEQKERRLRPATARHAAHAEAETARCERVVVALVPGLPYPKVFPY